MQRYITVKCKDGKTKKQHRIVWEAANGPIPPGYDIHHKNGNGRDNRLENLMMLTHQEHMRLHADLRMKGEDPVDNNDPIIIEYKKNKKIQRERYKERISESKKRWYQNNREYVIEHVREYARANKEKISARGKVYRAAHKEEMAAYQKEYRENNHEQRIQDEKEYRESHKEEIALGKKICYSVNTGKPKEYVDNLRKQLREMRERRKSAEELLEIVITPSVWPQ